MKKLIKNRFLYWAPRVLSIVFVLFLSLFSLDVFTEYQGMNVIVPLVIHLIPSFVLLLFVLVSWKYNLFGAVVFFAGAVFYIWMVGLDRPWSWYAAISGPAFLVSIFYFLNWLQRKKSS